MVHRRKRLTSDSVRVTVSLPRDQHERASRLAEKLRVSLAWVVRDAVEKYLERGVSLVTRPEDLDS
jgi:predicted transcriptional regulator